MSSESFNNNEFSLLEGSQHIRKRIIVEGIDDLENTLCHPKTGDQVSIHYVMKLLDQSIVDHSDPHLPFTFRLHCQQVLPEIDVCVSSMRKQERSEFLVDSTFMYGDGGLPGAISPKSLLVVWIHLLEIKEFCCVDKKCLNGTERIQAAIRAKDNGNELFKKNEKKKALEFYLQGVSLLESDNPEDTSLLEDSEAVAISLYLNAANCYTSLKDWNNVLNYSNKVLIYDANNCKALYRSGMVHLELKELEEAKNKLTKALKKEPRNKEILNQLHLWKAAFMVNSMRQKRLYGGIFHPKKTNSFRDSLTEQSMASSFSKSNLVGFVFQATAQSPLQAFYVEIYSKDVPTCLIDNFFNFCKGNIQLKSVSCRGYYNSRFQSIQKHVLLQGGPSTTLMPVTFVDSTKCFDTDCYCEGDFCLNSDAMETENFNFFIPLNSSCCKSANYVAIGSVCKGLSSLQELENLDPFQQDDLNSLAISSSCNSHTFPKIILSQII